jgi:hypothetical protein
VNTTEFGVADHKGGKGRGDTARKARMSLPSELERTTQLGSRWLH